MDANNGGIICRVQQCPAVLRQTVCDLFPNNSLEIAELSVVTITLKPDIQLLQHNKETETEKMAQTVSENILLYIYLIHVNYFSLF